MGGGVSLDISDDYVEEFGDNLEDNKFIYEGCQMNDDVIWPDPPIIETPKNIGVFITNYKDMTENFSHGDVLKKTKEVLECILFVIDNISFTCGVMNQIKHKLRVFYEDHQISKNLFYFMMGKINSLE